MTQKELIKKVSKVSGMTQKNVKKCLQAINEVKKEAFLNGEEKIADGLLIHNIKVTAERKGRNMRTGEPINIPPKKKIVTKVSQSVISEMNE